ncbi:hypothetical protein [Papillibacter cinnamivorans]|uniref:Phage protein, HK97 gp10 family n=1 Tax=Papillibacter cinnamivorans DSM 12816 TaxID=1122930 RepID=A0A1W1YT65_9FIRM|nr:hypothetical protein [Papillibacter cinnamivorans]SMC39410.1 phage protein, HK97 gp10 family [Papillibacter cinnamivorans DSM 12816]
MAHFKGSDIEIDGLDELIQACAQLPEDAMSYLKDGANAAGAIVLQKAKDKVPVLTGITKVKLKLTKAKKSSKTPYKIFSKVSAGKGAAAMGPLELGHNLVIHGHTVGAVKERPFLRPAADESKEEVADLMVKAMNRALESMGGVK